MAAMTEASSGSLRVLPSRRTDRSSITFSSLAWSAKGRRPTSSRKIAPPPAVWKSPALAWRASVNAPRSNPNSSASSRLSGIAAQLTSTNGPAPRPLARWSAAASSPLPVPVSPRMRTGGAAGPGSMPIGATAPPAPARRRWARCLPGAVSGWTRPRGPRLNAGNGRVHLARGPWTAGARAGRPAMVAEGRLVSGHRPALAPGRSLRLAVALARAGPRCPANAPWVSDRGATIGERAGPRPGRAGPPCGTP